MGVLLLDKCKKREIPKEIFGVSPQVLDFFPDIRVHVASIEYPEVGICDPLSACTRSLIKRPHNW